ncbi:MaoC family dehydratase N-terminal domain-containing protein [Acidobacteria bacterium AH-259-A15]|nr:MaoC family dehydratase N-terminal domain-containing protein [Acidobacteria bacterium AH-259-A15]
MTPTSVLALLKRLSTSNQTPVTFSKTVSESDVYLYAGITGDLHPNHVNKAYMQKTRYGERIAHGTLLIGYTSAASTRFCERLQGEHPNLLFVSYGYDRIRFIKPVLFGDTIVVNYRLARVVPEEAKLLADIKLYNQRDELVAVMTHILKAMEMEPYE